MYLKLEEVDNNDVETAVLSNEIIFTFLKTQALNRFDLTTREKA